MLHKSTLASLLVLIAAGLNSAELSRQGSRLAENLGMLLGLPLDEDVPRTNASAVPSFLMDVYNCWTELGSDDNRASCLPVGDRTAKHLNDVNVVRGIKGTGAYTLHLELPVHARTACTDSHGTCSTLGLPPGQPSRNIATGTFRTCKQPLRPRLLNAHVPLDPCLC